MDEYLDVLDEKGNKTGKKKLRSEVHRDGDWHAVVHVWIVNSKGELLLQKRSDTKESNPGMWDKSLGGHVLAGDDVIQGAKKEALEELGISLFEKELKFLIKQKTHAVLNDGKYFRNHFKKVYLLEKDFDIKKLEFQKKEISEIKYMPFLEVEKKIKEDDYSFMPHPEEYKKLFEVLHQKFDLISNKENNHGFE